MFRLVRKFVALVSAATFLQACSTLGVQPWERGILAKPEMALEADALTQGFDDHIYFSKEAVSGGRSFAGGGCGCN